MPTATALVVADPQPIVFPRDDGPHDRLTEWWYDTGHLRAADGRTFGFELVIFRAERGDLPVGWASHLAITDESGQRFLYDQRSEIGPQVNQSPPDGGLRSRDRRRRRAGLSRPECAGRGRCEGADGDDHLTAQWAARPATRLRASTWRLTPAIVRSRCTTATGYVNFGAGGWFLLLLAHAHGGERHADAGWPPLVPVTGEAWFDHQWGDFIAVGGGGWDWFALNLDDGTDITLSLVRAADGRYPLVYGTRVTPDGQVQHLDETRLHGDRDGSLDISVDWRDLPGRLAPRLQRRADRRPAPDRGGPGAGHARQRPVSSTGKARRSSQRRVPALRWAARRTLSSRGTQRADSDR